RQTAFSPLPFRCRATCSEAPTRPSAKALDHPRQRVSSAASTPPLTSLWFRNFLDGVVRRTSRARITWGGKRLVLQLFRGTPRAARGIDGRRPASAGLKRSKGLTDERHALGYFGRIPSWQKAQKSKRNGSDFGTSM